MEKENMSKIPLSASQSGSNAYYCNYCEHSQNRPPYAACLERISTVSSGETLSANNAACIKPIQENSCSALIMRLEEIEADEPLYYIERKKPNKDLTQYRPTQASPMLGASHSPKAPTQTTSQRAEKVKEKSFEVGSYADAVNKALNPTGER